MDRNNPFFRQVELLISVLPFVAKQACFALKGGTAINLFVRNLPRLSIDIDLAYIEIQDRYTSLKLIDNALREMAKDVETKLGMKARPVSQSGTDKIVKLNIAQGTTTVKIEVSPVMRGSVFDSELNAVSEKVQDLFGFVEMQLLNFDDLYAGKLCAALDRQHPRDLFDVKLLLENEGISKQLIKAFLVYLICQGRPIVETLDPNLIELSEYFKAEFEGMVFEDVALADLEGARSQLIEKIKMSLSPDDKQFLMSVKRGDPDWDLLELPHVQKLPAVKWKLHNISQMGKKKHGQAIEKLEKILS